MSESAPPPEAVGPLLRGVQVLRALSDAGGRQGIGELARATRLARSTVDRILATLTRMGYARVEGSEVLLAPRLMELGNAYLASAALPGAVADRLAGELDESVVLAVPDGAVLRVAHRATRRRAMSIAFGLGDPLPADDGGAGLEPGLLMLSAPVRDGAGRQVCAVAVVSRTGRHDADSLRRAAGAELHNAVREMEAALRDEAPVDDGRDPAGLADWTGASKQELGAGFVESLARGLTVVTAFGAGRARLGLSDVARATGLARATARRALITLEHLGLVRSGDGLFALTPAVLALGCPPLSRTSLPGAAAPYLAELVRRVHDSASMAVLDGDDIRYTARVATERIMSVTITLGTRFPAYATSMGRVLLADLPEAERELRLRRAQLGALTPRTVTRPVDLAAVLSEVGREGHALVDEELEEGLRSLAVPVRDRAGRVVAAVNVAMHSGRRTLGQCLQEVLPELRAAAARIEADLHALGRFGEVPPE
ncbi:IclR family transcriptional regulator C-terminal domain-containing protein [Streptomyces sp. NPDC001941]|uniref:IclR family transcriptional regulator domain-containing protein n=1 Tax=Streptomyces sp. NPDC001941 TaxID=3154659 RepID=UPI003328D8D9